MRLHHALLCGFVLASTPAFADHIYVESATGSGVNPSDLKIATELIQSSIHDVSSDDLVDQAGQADFVLKPNLVRIGDAFVLSLAKIKNGKITYSSKLKAARMEDLDETAERLTRTVLEGKRPAAPKESLEGNESQASNQPVNHMWFFSFGGSTFSNLNATGVGYSFGGAYAWDANQALIKIIGDASFNGSAFFLSTGLGGNYFLTRTPIAPYLSADFGAGLAKIDEGGIFSGQTVGGFAFGVGAGVQFMRTSEVHMDLGFRAGFLLHKNDLGTPEAFTLRLGLYF